MNTVFCDVLYAETTRDKGCIHRGNTAQPKRLPLSQHGKLHCQTEGEELAL